MNVVHRMVHGAAGLLRWVAHSCGSSPFTRKVDLIGGVLGRRVSAILSNETTPHKPQSIISFISCEGDALHYEIVTHTIDT